MNLNARTGSGLRWRKLSDEVAAALRRMILVGELAPGSRATQDELAQRLGVSTTPVREALLRLAAEGFVELSRGRSFTIARTTHGDVQDIYWMHATLAGELTARACSGADPDLLVSLRKLFDLSQQARIDGDAEAEDATNWAFHRAINVAAGSPKLLLMLRTTLRFIPTGFYSLIPAWGGESDDGHGQIMAAFENRDPLAARAAAEQHVRHAGALLADYFSHTGYWTQPAGSENGTENDTENSTENSTDGGTDE
jgi:DNA-binding GntR family transcriptional regulator